MLRLKKNLPQILLSMLVAGIWLPMLVKQSRQYDYVIHLRMVREIFEQGTIKAIHILFHLLTGMVSYVTRVGVVKSGLSVLLIANVAAALLLYRLWIDKFKTTTAIKLSLVLALLVVAPLQLLYFNDEHLYFGYIAITTYHNPTIQILKPLALLLFFGAVMVFSRPFENERARRRYLIAAPGVVVLSALAKPSYLVCFLPGLLCFGVIETLRGRKVDWSFLLFGFALPAILVLGVQFWLTYSEAQLAGVYSGESTMVFAPFAALTLWSKWLFPKFLMSFSFPLVVAIAYRKTLWQNKELLLAWLIFAVGAMWAYFFMESGPRMRHLNLVWGAQTSLFLLFLASVKHLFTATESGMSRWRDAKFLGCMGVFLLHTLCGLFWYVAELVNPERFW